MKLLNIKILVLLAFVAVPLNYTMCKVACNDIDTTDTTDTTNDTNTTPAKLTDFCLTDTDLSGWSVLPGIVCQANNTDLLWNGADGSINGIANEYIDRGLVEWSYQKMTAAGGKEATIYAEDFGTADNATSMYDYSLQNKVTSKQALASYAESIAVMDLPNPYVRQVYAHFGKFYFEMTLDGMTDNTETVKTSELYLGIFSSKVQ